MIDYNADYDWDLTKKNSYIFSVPATMIYQIDADTEEEAREILEERGGGRYSWRFRYKFQGLSQCYS